MSKRYNPPGLMYTALDNARKLSRSAAAKKRGSRVTADDFPEALLKTKKAPSVKDLKAIVNFSRRADEILAYPTLAVSTEEEEKKKKKKKEKRMERRKGESKKIYERKNISEKTRWMP